MILDTSAVVAIVLEEPGHEHLQERVASVPNPGIGAPTLAETAIVLTGKLGPLGRTVLDRFIVAMEVEAIPFGNEHWPVAFEGFARYGKGRHRAGLNFGDCLTYAVAKLAGEPLLALGDDFGQTDLELA